jgi:Methyltransferase domain
MDTKTVVKDPYWEQRKDSIYLYVARAVCKQYGGKPKSVIDVGSNQTPTLEWHRATASRLVSLDLRRPYVADGVESMTRDFFGYLPDETFDLATCFQVLEHVPDPAAFADKLLQISKVTIVSVPYKWKRGKCKYHIHDPVDEDKMLEWFGKKPAYTYVARELTKVARMIHVYKNVAA